MAFIDVSNIQGWHAHVYFDAASRDAAQAFREEVTAQFGDRVEMGRFHEREVGPHPRWSYQIAFAPTQFSDVVGWLALNHGALDVFVHPNTGDELRDHRDSALWLGRSHQLDLGAVGG
jgi:aromatic ring-cleaving dioxygenase